VDLLMSRIATARRQGWSLVNQELEEGLISLAAPLVNRAGRPAAPGRGTCKKQAAVSPRRG
ncbi:MAG: hypothetical protein EOO28_34355, partial [Comamonadaceae bacterium]